MFIFGFGSLSASDVDLRLWLASDFRCWSIRVACFAGAVLICARGSLVLFDVDRRWWLALQRGD
jgi:hypothetical protein